MSAPKNPKALAKAWFFVVLVVAGGVVVDVVQGGTYTGGSLAVRPWMKTTSLAVSGAHLVAIAIMFWSVLRYGRGIGATVLWFVALAASAGAFAAFLTVGPEPFAPDSKTAFQLTLAAYMPSILRDVALFSAFDVDRWVDKVAGGLIAVNLVACVHFGLTHAVNVTAHTHMLGPAPVMTLPWGLAAVLIFVSWSRRKT